MILKTSPELKFEPQTHCVGEDIDEILTENSTVVHFHGKRLKSTVLVDFEWNRQVL